MVSKAFVFPGQGSQSVGMLGDLYDEFPLVRDLFAEASEQVGYDVYSLVKHGPLETLNQTQHTQVAMLVADVAIYKSLQYETDVKADMMAGHSLGEYAALVCANALSFADAVKLVSIRGKCMQDNVPMGIGAMAAIVGLEDGQVAALCEKASLADEQVTPANYNAIGQVVIAGHKPAVERAIALADEIGARLAKTIPVSVPCHCPLLNKASEEFAQALQTVRFQTPSVPVISNVDIAIYASPTQIRQKLTEQLYSPVRWVETIELMKQKGIQLVVECGPGRVLAGLVKRIDRSIQTITIYDKPSLDTALTTLNSF